MNVTQLLTDTEKCIETNEERFDKETKDKGLVSREDVHDNDVSM